MRTVTPTHPLAEHLARLHGHPTDFDDCYVAVAEALGMRTRAGWTLEELLDHTCRTINDTSWATVRIIGTDVYDTLRR